MGRILTLILICLLSAGFANAAIYKWVDRAGRVHYADSPPHDNAEEVELSEPTIYSPASNSGSQPSTNGAATKAPPFTGYTNFAITYPTNKSTVRNIDKELIVTFSATPFLQKNHYIQLILDGDIQPEKLRALSYPLSGLGRGTHFIQASIMDAAGRLQKRAPIVQFYVYTDTVVEDGKAPEPPESGSSDEKGKDASQFSPEATPDFSGEPATPGVDNTGFKPSGKSIPSTPGQTNPAFTPSYNK